jgi:hypothetical protein
MIETVESPPQEVYLTKDRDPGQSDLQLYLMQKAWKSTARSGGPTGVAMVESADLRQCDHLSHLRWLYSSPIAEQISRSCIPGKGLDDLLASPGCRWGIGDVEVDNEASSVGQNDTGIENPECRSGNSKEIDGSPVPHMVAEEGFPGLG